MSVSVEFVLKWIEEGSNSMQVYSNILNFLRDGQTYQLVSDTGAVIATIVNLSPMLQPIRIQANAFAATAIILKVVSDWQDPNKKVEPGDVITLIGQTGVLVATFVVASEIAPEVAVAGFAIALASDLSSTFNNYLTYIKFILRPIYQSLLSFEIPLSTDAASLYWISGFGDEDNLATYDEVMDPDGTFYFMKLVDGSLIGLAPNTLEFADSAIPGSLTPVDDSSYLQYFCRNAGDATAECMASLS